MANIETVKNNKLVRILLQTPVASISVLGNDLTHRTKTISMFKIAQGQQPLNFGHSFPSTQRRPLRKISPEPGGGKQDGFKRWYFL
jgi:hypothetical protein